MRRKFSRVLSCFVAIATLLLSVNVLAVKDEAVTNGLTVWKSSVDNEQITKTNIVNKSAAYFTGTDPITNSSGTDDVLVLKSCRINSDNPDQGAVIYNKFKEPFQGQFTVSFDLYTGPGTTISGAVTRGFGLSFLTSETAATSTSQFFATNTSGNKVGYNSAANLASGSHEDYSGARNLVASETGWLSVTATFNTTDGYIEGTVGDGKFYNTRDTSGSAKDLKDKTIYGITLQDYRQGVNWKKYIKNFKVTFSADSTLYKTTYASYDFENDTVGSKPSNISDATAGVAVANNPSTDADNGNTSSKVVNVAYSGGDMEYINIPIATATNNLKIGFKVLPYKNEATGINAERCGLGVGLVYDDGTDGIIAYTNTSAGGSFYVAHDAKNNDISSKSPGTLADGIVLSKVAGKWNDLSVNCDLTTGIVQVACGDKTYTSSAINGLSGRKVVGVKLYNGRKNNADTKYFDDISITAINPDNNGILAAYSASDKIFVIFRDEIASANAGNFTLESSAQSARSITDVSINGKIVTLTLDGELVKNSAYTVSSAGLKWKDGYDAVGNKVTVVPEVVTARATINGESAECTITKNSYSPIDIMIIAADYSDDGKELTDARVINVSYSAGKHGIFTNTVDLTGYSKPKIYIWTDDYVPLMNAAE